MADLTNHNTALNCLEQARDADRDQREQVRDSDHFLNKKDGMWDPDVINRRRGRPKYTFDRTNPLVDQISGEIRQNDFALRVSPAGSDATVKDAQTFDGLIRNIRNMSDADMIVDAAAECMVGTGLSGWEVVQEYANSDSFDQDLLLKPLMNFEDRVWFDPNYKMQDASDADWVFVLDNITTDKYKEMFPKGSGMSIGQDRTSSAYYNKAETVTVGRLLWKKDVKKTLVKMSNGAVYEDDEDFKKIKDELAQVGIVEEDRREKKTKRVYSRMLDGAGWLTEEEETVFSFLPIIQCVANFRISEGKVIYRGLAQMVMDQQRLVNYYGSREAEEIALSPKPRYWATREQAKGHVDKWRRMNIDNDPVTIYTHDPENPGPPKWQGDSTIDPGLIQAKQSAEQGINATAGLFSANQGSNPNLQSGVALNSQIDQGNISQSKYFAAVQIALCYTGKVLIDAIPRVYDSKRTVRIIGDDGSSELVTLHDVVIDSETGQPVEINDLSKGQYDVVCDIGPAFKNRQDEANNAFTQLISANPAIAPIVQDLWVKNIPLPEMDKAAERLRAQALTSGVIPQEQLSDEEKAAIQKQQAEQGQQPDPAMVLAMAEDKKAQAELQNAANKANELQLDAAKIQLDAQNKAANLQSQTELNQAKTIQTQQGIEQKQQQIDLQAQAQQFSQLIELQKASMQETQMLRNDIKTQAEALKILREAIGVDAMVGPNNTEAYIKQANEVQESQDESG